jgi:hypothetical protein
MMTLSQGHSPRRSGLGPRITGPVHERRWRTPSSRGMCAAGDSAADGEAVVGHQRARCRPVDAPRGRGKRQQP